MVSAKTLKLDMSFRPIEIIDAVEALVLCLVGKAQAVETHMIEINSVNNRFRLPSVIALKRIVKFHFKTTCQVSLFNFVDKVLIKIFGRITIGV